MLIWKEMSVIILNSTVQRQQSDILVRAINNYLRRPNNTEPNYRNSETTSWIDRCVDSFGGKTRANNLKQALTSEPIPNPIELLQTYFFKNSRVGDHSLNIYLLKSILNNKHLFLLTNEFTNLSTINSRRALQEFIMAQEIRAEPEYAYLIAKLYQEDITALDNLQYACAYYGIALQQGHDASREALNILVRTGNSDAEYVLQFECFHRRGEFNEAIGWCMRAALEQSPQAIPYLFETQFTVEQYLIIARKYDQGNGAPKNSAICDNPVKPLFLILTFAPQIGSDFYNQEMNVIDSCYKTS